MEVEVAELRPSSRGGRLNHDLSAKVPISGTGLTLIHPQIRTRVVLMCRLIGSPIGVYGFLQIFVHHLGQAMARARTLVDAVAYLRTSSAANVGPDKDSDKRQRAAIESYAKREGFRLVSEFNDAAVSGADPIETRRGFAELLDRIESNGVRIVIVEDASRFARELMTQELGIVALIRRGVRVLTAGGDDLTDSSDPSRKMMRQIAGAFHEYEKARLVAKLRGARERKRVATGKCEGRKSHAEQNPALVLEATRLRRKLPKGGRRSLRDVAAELARLGHVNERGAPFSASSIKSMTEA
jgi:DNA invertase Pin-like site-specific DNA recombinase